MNPEILNVEVFLLYLLSKHPGIRERPNVVVVVKYVKQEFLPVIYTGCQELDRIKKSSGN